MEDFLLYERKRVGRGYEFVLIIASEADDVSHKKKRNFTSAFLLRYYPSFCV